MAGIQHGEPVGPDPFYQAKDVWEVTDLGDRIRREYFTAYSTWRLQAPAVGSAHPLAPLALLTRAVAAQVRAPDRCRVTLYYEQSSPSTGQALPEMRYSDNGASIRTDLRAHPRYAEVSDEDRATINDWVQSPREGQSPALAEPLSIELYQHLVSGFTHYLDGAFEVTKTTYTASQPNPDPAKYGRAADPGGGYGSAGHWIRSTGGTRKEGAFWAEDEVFVYSARELPEGIYT